MKYFYKMAVGGHFDVRKSMQIFIFFEFFLQNGCRWPFWMSENHFRSHFWPFQIDTQLSFFWNVWQNGWRRPFWMSEFHFRSHFWPFQIDRPFWISKNSLLIAILAISDGYRFFFKFLTKWPLATILDVWKSLSIAFLAISDWSAIFDVRNSPSMAFLSIWQNVGHFGCPQITFDRISGHFRSIYTQLFFGWDDNVNYRTRTRYLDEQSCVKFEERSLNPSKVIALTTKLWCGGPRGGGGGCVADENIIFPKTYVSREYN